eukprot:538404-Alexandrium_andersonii.AAC.1
MHARACAPGSPACLRRRTYAGKSAARPCCSRFAGMHAQARTRRQGCGTTALMPTLCDQAARIGLKAPS